MKRRQVSVVQEAFEVTRELIGAQRFTVRRLAPRLPHRKSTQISAALHNLAGRGLGVRLGGMVTMPHGGRRRVYFAVTYAGPLIDWRAGFADSGVTRKRRLTSPTERRAMDQRILNARGPAITPGTWIASPGTERVDELALRHERTLRDVARLLRTLAEQLDQLADSSLMFKRQAD